MRSYLRCADPQDSTSDYRWYLGPDNQKRQACHVPHVVVVVTPSWVSNAIEQEIEGNKRRPKVADIGIAKLPVVVHGSMSEVELPSRKRKRTK
jgi:hypothetical protein